MTRKTHHLECLSDWLTPDYLSPNDFLLDGFFLLESTETTGNIFSTKDLTPPMASRRWTIASSHPTKDIRLTQENGLNWLQEVLDRDFQTESSTTDIPFTGGWVGFLSYEAYSLFPHLCRVPQRLPDLTPLGYWAYYPEAYLYDHLEKKAYWLSSQPESSHPLRDSLLHKMEGGLAGEKTDKPKELPHIHSSLNQEEYNDRFEKIQRHILEGTTYQVNLTRRLSWKANHTPEATYALLKKKSPAPFASFLRTPLETIVSNSPECFLDVQEDRVLTFPIKGTRARLSAHEDEATRQELFISPKDRAELLMITDLLRNDLGQVCRSGSINVSSLAHVETFTHQHHLVSSIEGRLKERKISTLLAATFPGGSVTGAPKHMAMTLIHELEPVPRNIYTGLLGYVSAGQAKFALPIRTFLFSETHTYYHTGGGIVVDSNSQEEWMETEVKAKVLKDL